MIPSTTQSQALAALRAFLLAILPVDTEVLQSQVNRVAEAEGDDFVMMTPMRRPRLSTNRQTNRDCGFIASAEGNVLTVATMLAGTILAGALVQGTGLRENPRIDSQLSGETGGVGTYRLTAAQSTVLAEVMQSGVVDFEQSAELEIQLDLHGPASADNAQTVSTLTRSDYATRFFAEVVDVGGVAVPLHADDPRQAPFLNDQQQYENRWVVSVLLQVDPVVSVPQQFTDSAAIVAQSVDATFPPGG